MAHTQEKKQHLHNEFGTMAVGMLLGALSINIAFPYKEAQGPVIAHAQEEQQHLHIEVKTMTVGMLLEALYVALCFILGSRLLRKQPKTTTFSSTKNDNVTGSGQLSLENWGIRGLRLLRKQPKTTIFSSTKNDNVTESEQLVLENWIIQQLKSNIELTVYLIAISTLISLADVFGDHSIPCWLSPCCLLGSNCHVLFGRKPLDLNPYLEVVAFLAVFLLARQLTRTLWRFIFTKVINSSRTLLSTLSDQSHKEKIKRWKRSLDLVYKHLVWIRIVPPH